MFFRSWGVSNFLNVSIRPCFILTHTVNDTKNKKNSRHKVVKTKLITIVCIFNLNQTSHSLVKLLKSVIIQLGFFPPEPTTASLFHDKQRRINCIPQR